MAFPTSPINGQTTTQNGLAYTYNSTLAAWALTTSTTGAISVTTVTATDNVTGGNILTTGIVSATGNVTGVNLLTTGTVSATGNITGGNVLGGANVNATTHTGTTVSITGNVTGANIIGFSRPSTGTASLAPILLTSGTNLTTAAAGAVEYDGSFFYATPQTTNGRQVINTPSYYVLSADAAAVGAAIAQFFPGTTAIPLVASGIYEIEFNCWFLKTTAGTLVWTLTNSTTVTKMHAEMQMSPITGVTSTNATSELTAQVANQTAASVAFVATGSLTTGVNHFMRMRVYLVNGSSTSLRLNVTNSAGTVTPLGGSYWRATRIASIGTLAA